MGVTEAERRYRQSAAGRARRREQTKRYYEKYPEKRRAAKRRHKIKAKYGLTVEEYEALIAQPCAICGSSENVRLDHNHANGKVRAGLCHSCNVALGHFKDDPMLMRAAAVYVEGHDRIGT